MPKYSVVSLDADDATTFVIQLDEGEHAGSQFNFGKIEFAGEDGEGNGIINFEYDVIKAVPAELTKEQFDPVASVILHQILTEMVDRADIDKDIIVEDGVEVTEITEIDIND